MYLFQFSLGRSTQLLHRTKMFGEKLGRPLADMTNSKAKKQPAKIQTSALVNFHHERFRGLPTHPLEFLQLGHRESVEIGNIVHDLPVHQLINQTLTQAVYVHRLAARPMQQSLLELCRTCLRYAAPNGFALQSIDFTATDWAAVRHDEPAAIRSVFHDFHNFGDNVAATLEKNRIVDADAKTLDLVLIVKCCAPNRRAAQHHGFENRYGRERTGSTHLDTDI